VIDIIDSIIAEEIRENDRKREKIRGDKRR